MKKITLCLAIIASLAFSCKNKPKADNEETTQEVTEVTEDQSSEEETTKTVEVTKQPVIEKKKPVQKVVKEKPAAPVKKKEIAVKTPVKQDKTITLKSGAQIITTSAAVINTKDLSEGQEILLNIKKDIISSGGIVITRGSKALAKVKAIQKEKKMSGVSKLDLVLTQITIQGKKYTTHSDLLHFQGKNRTSNTAIKAGVGAGLGAAVGALVSKKKGKGAAIGAAIGAVAGGATNAVAKKKSLILDEHTEMIFTLSQALKFSFKENF
ncbi:YMGG-like glycine zipper-containing protein [Prolixibacteraceae bacterium]|nr:YMGG-like glycine zipper-containing protein [Prolixibacteraceae bacterium]